MTVEQQSQVSRADVLKRHLTEAIAAALPAVYGLDAALQSTSHSYEAIARVLVDLRHEFRTPDGVSPDLKGRSRGYRRLVREAYESAGVHGQGPIEKRMTVGVAYWVRKLLVDRYGEEALRELGVLPGMSAASMIPRPRRDRRRSGDPSACLVAVVALLNELAIDPGLMVDEDVVRSAARAISLIQRRVSSRPSESPQFGRLNSSRAS